jgi:sensor histidine kinase regulating citrate/malate metabolism
MVSLIANRADTAILTPVWTNLIDIQIADKDLWIVKEGEREVFDSQVELDMSNNTGLGTYESSRVVQMRNGKLIALMII